MLTFNYVANNGVANTAIDPGTIEISAKTPMKAPETGRYDASGIIDAEGNGQSETVRTGAVVTPVKQSQASSHEKLASSEDEIEATETELSWRMSWFNFLNEPAGELTMFDILPHDGDANGSNFSGTVRLTKAKLWGDAAGDGTEVWVTSDAADSVVTDPSDSTTKWQKLADVDLNVFEATAIKVVTPDIGLNFEGGLDITMEQSDGVVDDNYLNSLRRWTDNGSGWVQGNDTMPSGYRIVASSVSGVAWWDANGNGLQDDDAAALEGAEITATNTDTGEEYTTTVTNGTWTLEGLLSGTYTVTADFAGVDGVNVSFTTQNAGSDDAVDSDFGTDPITVSLTKNQDLSGFGLGLRDANLAVEKTVLATADGAEYVEKGDYTYGDTVTWQIKASNAGHTNLTGVRVTDAIENLTSTDDTCVALASDGVETDLVAGDDITINCTATASASLTNAATAVVGDYEAVTDTADIDVTAENSIKVEKFVKATEDGDNWEDEKATRDAGQQATWRIVVTNTGQLPLTNVRVVDAIADEAGEATSKTMTWTDPSDSCVALADAAAYQKSSGGWTVGELAPGESQSVECTSAAEQGLTNLAWATGDFQPINGGDPEAVTDTDRAELVVPDPVVPEKETPDTEILTPQGDDLANTGFGSMAPAIVGLILLAAGVIVVIAARRRRQTA